MQGALRGALGPLVVDSCLAAGAPPPEPRPAFLAPVWAFDHEVEGQPAASTSFLGLDLEVLASRSPDEEVGVALEGRPGLWLVRARPLCSGDFVP